MILDFDHVSLLPPLSVSGNPASRQDERNSMVVRDTTIDIAVGSGRDDRGDMMERNAANQFSDERFDVIIEHDPDHGAWVTYVPSLNNLSTYGDTREEAIEHTREAIRGYLRVATRKGLPIPASRPARPTGAQQVVHVRVGLATT